MKYLTTGLLGSVVTAVAAFGAPAIEIVAGPGDLAGEFAAGQVVSVSLYAASASDAGVFGVELALAAASNDCVIRAVTFAPTFSQAVGEVSPAVAIAAAAEAAAGNAPPGDAAAAPNALPGRQYRAVRSQAVGTPDRALAGGEVD